MRFAILIVLASAALAQDKASSSRKSEIRKLYLEYFKNPDRRPEILAQIRSDDALAKSDVASFVSYANELAKSTGPKLDPKGGQFAHPKYPGKIIVRGVASGKQGLAISLHGGGENFGEGAHVVGWTKPIITKGYITIFPTVLKKKALEWSVNPDEEQYVLELVRAAIRTFQIDTNRVVLMGRSMGGYGAWHIGGHNADLFAGLVSHAGGILGGEAQTWGGGILANLYQTPIFFTHGAKDDAAPIHADRRAAKILGELREKYGGYEHKYIENPDQGHAGIPADELASIEFLVKQRRNPLPKRVIWEPLRTPKRLFFWLAVDEPKDRGRIEAQIKGNEIELTGEGPISLLLNDKLVNLSKNVIVRRNGQEVFNGPAAYSASAILESVADKMDPDMTFTARIDLK